MTTVDIGTCCQDCMLAIEGTNEDATPNQAERTDAGIARLIAWNGLSSLHTGDSEGFSRSSCDICGSPFAGERFQLFGLK